MLYEIPDLAVDDSESLGLPATDSSRATTNGHDKPSGDKLSVVKSSNGTKSNGSKSSKGKSSSKSKPSKEKISARGSVDLLPDAPAPSLSETEQVSAVPAPDVSAPAAPEPAVPASDLPAPPRRLPLALSTSESAISFSTTIPDTGEVSAERMDDKNSFVRANLVPLALGIVCVCLAVALRRRRFS